MAFVNHEYYVRATFKVAINDKSFGFCVPFDIHRRLKAIDGDGCRIGKNFFLSIRRGKMFSTSKVSVFDEQRSIFSGAWGESKKRECHNSRKSVKQRDVDLEQDICQERMKHVTETLNLFYIEVEVAVNN